MKQSCKTHTLQKPKVGRLSVTKRKRGINALTDTELATKTQQELYNDVKGCYAIQTIAGTKFLRPERYDTLEKLAAFKAKNPGSYMKNNLNKMRKVYDTLNNQKPASLAALITLKDASKTGGIITAI
jgi:hypothetical protein